MDSIGSVCCKKEIIGTEYTCACQACERKANKKVKYEVDTTCDPSEGSDNSDISDQVIDGATVQVQSSDDKEEVLPPPISIPLLQETVTEFTNQ